MAVCPFCRTSCPGAEVMIEFVSELLAEGYKEEYVIIIDKLYTYRVRFAHPKKKLILEFEQRQKKTDATRAMRILKRDQRLKSKGWKISRIPPFQCS